MDFEHSHDEGPESSEPPTPSEAEGAERPESTAAVIRVSDIEEVKVVSLELDNFKSFERKTTIPFRDGFTTISGPNGSGKSNIIDSLLFVLGLSGSKGMRAERLTDLMNAGSKKKYARVALKLAVKRRGQEAQTIEVARKVRRTRSNYVAHYELDGVVKKASELQEVLGSIGLSAHGMNIVLQGDVTSLTKMSPLNRRRVLDDVAGISEFDRRITAARDELTQAGRHMEDIELILSELGTRLEGLSKERETALRYRRLREVKESLEEELVLLVAQRARDELAQLESKLEALRARRAELEKERERALEAHAQAELALAAAEEAYRSKGEGERLRAFERRERLRGLLTSAEERIKAARAESESLKAKGETQRAELARHELNLKSLLAEESELTAKLEGLASQHEQVSQEVGRAMTEIRRQGATQAKNYEEIQRLQVAQRSLRGREQDLGQRASELVEREAKLVTEGEVLGRKVGEHEARRALLEREEAESASGRREAREQLSREEERQRRLRSRLSSVRGQQDKVSDAYYEAERKLARAEERMSSVRKYTDSHALRVIRDSGIDGVHGTVRELCSYDAEIAVAMESAAGGRMSWVIVEDETVAKRCIETLKRQRAGRLTFAPLTRIRAPQLRLDRIARRGVVGYAIQLVDFDRQYEEVFRYVLGDTLIIDDLKTGLPLMGRTRMVTLEGDLLEKRGLMTGGQKPRAAEAIANLARIEKESAALSAELESLKSKRRKLYRDAETAEAEERAATSVLPALQGRVAEVGAVQLRLKGELESIDRVLQPDRARLDELVAELEELRVELGAVKSEREQMLGRQNEDDVRLRGLGEVLGSEGYEELNEETRDKELKQRALEEAMAAVRDNLQRAQVKIQDLRARMELLNASLEEGQARRAELEAVMAELSEEQSSASVELAALDLELGKISAELEALDEQRRQAQRVAQQAEQAVKSCERELGAAELGLEGAVEKVGAARAAFAERMRDLEARQVSVPDYPEDGYESGEDPATLAAQAEKSLKKTTKQMETLEPVNMLAIDQYNEISERKAELDGRLEVLRQEKDALLERIEKLEEIKKTTFMEAFRAVRDAFHGSFRELARGDGELRLEDDEDPFAGGLIIEARPRGKKLVRLEAMSGGEKSLTALAFIFALQSINPAPFYIFDEVDQSLDGANTELLASAIRNRSRLCQYLVVSHHQALLEESAQLLGVTLRKGRGSRVTGIAIKQEDDELTVEAKAVGA